MVPLRMFVGDILHYLKSHRSSRDQRCRWVVLSEGLLWWWDHPGKASHVVKNKRLWYGGRFGNFGRICPFIGVENSDNGWWWWTGWRGSSYLTDSLTQQLCQPLILENQDPTMSLLCFSFHLEPPFGSWVMTPFSGTLCGSQMMWEFYETSLPSLRAFSSLSVMRGWSHWIQQLYEINLTFEFGILVHNQSS